MFITFEGLDGSGKSTQAKMLYESLCKKNVDALLTREPGGTKIAEKIRDLMVHNELQPMTELLLVNAARYEHVIEVILPSLRSNKTVICDRFVDSTMVYQGIAQKLGKRLPAMIHNLIMEGVTPDVTFIIDIDPEIAQGRLQERTDHNKFDRKSPEFHKKIRQGFLEIARIAPSRCIVLDGSHSVDKLHQMIISMI